MSAAPSALLEPTPFKWRDPASFPRRRFAYGGHYGPPLPERDRSDDEDRQIDAEPS